MQGRATCPGCGEAAIAVPTAYGERLTCYKEGRKWTRLIGEGLNWTEEKYSPITDNCHVQ